jgi:hypothetical protein
LFYGSFGNAVRKSLEHQHDIHVLIH